MAGKLRPAFLALHHATLDPATRPDELAHYLRTAEAVTDRHRLAEGAVYASACRRYQLDTGVAWRSVGLSDATAVWDVSDHTYRLRSRVDGSYDARCSCGAAVVVFAEPDGALWHAAHLHAVAEQETQD